MRPRPPGPSAVALAAGLAGLCAAGPAEAVEGEWQLGLEPAYAMAYTEAGGASIAPSGAGGRAASGGGGLLRLAYSPRDSLSLQLLGGAAAHPPSGDGLAPGLVSFSAGAGLVYVFDVVRIVPFFELDVGLIGVRTLPGEGAGPAETRLALGLGVGFGADYLISRRLSVGVAARWATALTDLQGLPLYLTVGPRLNLRFGD